MSQFMARYLDETGKDLSQFKETIRDEDDRTIRHFLSGDLRVEMLALLKRAGDDGGEVHAALYELEDEELVGALAALGSRAHVVLANGSISQRDGETTAEARKRDQNEHGRAELRKAGVDVETSNRFISPGALGHNKFLVLSDSAGKPQAAWTGSTNWTPTGLCTQLNNGAWPRTRTSPTPTSSSGSDCTKPAASSRKSWSTRTRSRRRRAPTPPSGSPAHAKKSTWTRWARSSTAPRRGSSS